MNARDTFLALIVAMLWGAQVTAVKIGGSEFPPILMVAIRFAIMSIFLFPFIFRLRRHQFRSVFLIASVTGTVHFGLLYCGISLADASTAAIIYQLATPFTLLLAVVVLREAINAQVISGILLALTGVIILFFNPAASGSVLGMVLVAMAALMFASGSVLTKYFGPLDPLALSAWTAIISAPELLIWSLIQESGQWSGMIAASYHAWAAVLYTAVSGGLVGFGLWFWLLSRYSVQTLSPFLLLVPLFAVVVSQVMLSEGLSARLLLGTVMTMLGVALCQLRWPLRRKQCGSLEGRTGNANN